MSVLRAGTWEEWLYRECAEDGAPAGERVGTRGRLSGTRMSVWRVFARCVDALEGCWSSLGVGRGARCCEESGGRAWP